MRIITKKDAEPAVVTELKTMNLDIMQNLVGGLIQPVYMDNMICWVNEEGKLNGLDVNIALVSADGELLDTLHGDVFFTNDEEENEGLTSLQIKSLLERINDGLCTFAHSDMHEVPIMTI